MEDTKIDTSGPAFPWGDVHTGAGGMTLRDKFAERAMGTLLLLQPSDEGLKKFASRNPDGLVADYIAEKAYLMADAMLKARAA
jgi:hypothetical protein